MTQPDATLQQTPLIEAHRRAGARLVPFAGWEMPLSYSGQLEEHQAVRERVGIFDVSHMGEVRVRGPQALAFLQHLVPGNVGGLPVGKGRYTQLCNERGGVIDDLIVSRLAEDEFFAVVNASRRDVDMAWIRRQATALGFTDLVITDESVDWAMIAIQGPAALELLEDLLPGTGWCSTAPFTMHPFDHDGRPHLLSRTGYTGESGAELLCPATLAEPWWITLLDAGGVPCGLAARDSLRLEAGYCLYGNDLDEETTPLEAGLGWSVGWKKPERFVGRDVLEKQKAEGAPRRLVGLKNDTRRPLRPGDRVLHDGQPVGDVRSGGFSPGRSCGIALAYVSAAVPADAALEIESRGRTHRVVQTRPPFAKTGLNP